jgi:hypothetical protein
LEGRQALRTLLRANKRLNTAYLLKESFGQLWSYEHEGWARRSAMQNEIVCIASAWRATAMAPDVAQDEPEHENLVFAGRFQR